jgi:hypothetical protein
LTISGEDAGTFGNPNVEKILEKSKPSPFGKGDKTAMDLEYRNGREVVAADRVIGSAAQPDAKKGVPRAHRDSYFPNPCLWTSPSTLSCIHSQYMGRKGILIGIETQHIAMITTPVLVALNTTPSGRAGVWGSDMKGKQ